MCFAIAAKTIFVIIEFFSQFFLHILLFIINFAAIITL